MRVPPSHCCCCWARGSLSRHPLSTLLFPSSYPVLTSQWPMRNTRRVRPEASTAKPSTASALINGGGLPRSLVNQSPSHITESQVTNKQSSSTSSSTTSDARSGIARSPPPSSDAAGFSFVDPEAPGAKVADGDTRLHTRLGLEESSASAPASVRREMPLARAPPVVLSRSQG